MLYAQNGATDAELRHDEHEQNIRVSGKKNQLIQSPDLDPVARFTRFAGNHAGDGGGRP